MIDPIQDPLADRLRAIQLETPRNLIPSVLAAVGKRRSRSLRQLFRRVAVPIALVVLLTGASSYVSPRFADALASAPVIGGPAGDLLRGIGMARAEGRMTGFSETATAANFRVRLVGGYADAFQTLVVIHIEDLRRQQPAVHDRVTLTDQFGHSYELLGASWSTQHPGGVDEAMTFEPYRWPATWTGARLTLAIADMQLGTTQHEVQGPWTLHATLAIQDVRDLPLPSDGRIGTTTFHFTALRTSPVGLQVQMTVDGPLASRLDDVISVPDGKPRPALTIQLTDAHGVAQQPIEGRQTSGNANQADAEWLWVVPDSGRYQLVVDYAGAGSFTKAIVIP